MNNIMILGAATSLQCLTNANEDSSPIRGVSEEKHMITGSARDYYSYNKKIHV